MMTSTPDLVMLVVIAACLGFISGVLLALRVVEGSVDSAARRAREQRRREDAAWDAAARAHREGVAA